jgi:hypothetical protein
MKNRISPNELRAHRRAFHSATRQPTDREGAIREALASIGYTVAPAGSWQRAIVRKAA